jgi:hypothetical protein
MRKAGETHINHFLYIHYESYKRHDSQKRAWDAICYTDHSTESNVELYLFSSYKLHPMITNSLTQVYDVLSTGATGRHDPWLEASQSVGGTEQQRRGEAFLSLAPLNFKPSHKSSIPNDPHNTSTSLVRIATVVPLPTQKSKNKLSCVITKHIRTSTTFQFRKPWLSFCKPREQVLVQGAVCACALLRDLDSVLTPPFPRDAITIHSRLLADGKSSFQRENVAPPRYPSLLSNTENRLRFS